MLCKVLEKATAVTLRAELGFPDYIDNTRKAKKEVSTGNPFKEVAWSWRWMERAP